MLAPIVLAGCPPGGSQPPPPPPPPPPPLPAAPVYVPRTATIRLELGQPWSEATGNGLDAPAVKGVAHSFKAENEDRRYDHLAWTTEEREHSILRQTRFTGTGEYKAALNSVKLSATRYLKNYQLQRFNSESIDYLMSRFITVGYRRLEANAATTGPYVSRVYYGACAELTFHLSRQQQETIEVDTNGTTATLNVKYNQYSADVHAAFRDETKFNELVKHLNVSCAVSIRGAPGGELGGPVGDWKALETLLKAVEARLVKATASDLSDRLHSLALKDIESSASLKEALSKVKPEDLDQMVALIEAALAKGEAIGALVPVEYEISGVNAGTTALPSKWNYARNIGACLGYLQEWDTTIASLADRGGQAEKDIASDAALLKEHYLSLLGGDPDPNQKVSKEALPLKGWSALIGTGTTDHGGRFADLNALANYVGIPLHVRVVVRRGEEGGEPVSEWKGALAVAGVGRDLVRARNYDFDYGASRGVNGSWYVPVTRQGIELGLHLSGNVNDDGFPDFTPPLTITVGGDQVIRLSRLASSSLGSALAISSTDPVPAVASVSNVVEKRVSPCTYVSKHVVELSKAFSITD